MTEAISRLGIMNKVMKDINNNIRDLISTLSAKEIETMVVNMISEYKTEYNVKYQFRTKIIKEDPYVFVDMVSKNDKYMQRLPYDPEDYKME